MLLCSRTKTHTGTEVCTGRYVTILLLPDLFTFKRLTQGYTKKPGDYYILYGGA
jgi:hypothetical protein